MATELTWLGHGSWSLRIGDEVVLLDPFLDESPTAPTRSADIEADFILVSHGHFDHVSDAAAIANRTGATVIANFEVADWLARKQNVKSTVGMNLGGRLALSFGTVKMTVAWHSSQLPDGSYGGSAAGFLLSVPDGSIYFACDTALFSDMQLIGSGGVDLAILPIGDLFTMGPDDALEAVKLIKPKRVVPDHYNTWPPVNQDPETWAQRVRQETTAEPVLMQPGDTIQLVR